jgi:hypothetical protein
MEFCTFLFKSILLKIGTGKSKNCGKFTRLRVTWTANYTFSKKKRKNLKNGIGAYKKGGGDTSDSIKHNWE